MYGDEQAAEAAFARAAHVTRLTLDSTRVSGTPMEPKACVVAYDAKSESFDVYTSTQGLALMLPNFVAITGVPAEKIRIHAQDVGGGFGIRSQAYPEYCALMLAAKLGKPVKWVGSRFETIVSDHHGRAAHLEGELALDRDGRFLGLRVRWVVNVGAYLSQPGPLINTLNPATHAINVYRIPALYGRHLLALTNTTSTTAYRGAGRPNVSYLVERLVDEAARETRHRPHRAAAPQLHSEGGVPLQDAGRLDLRQRRSGGRIRGSAGEIGLGQLRVAQKRILEKRQAARHRLRRVLRALGRRRGAEGRSGDPLRRLGQRDAARARRAVRAGARDGLAGGGRRNSRT